MRANGDGPIVLGLSGGTAQVRQAPDALSESRISVSFCHDAAAVVTRGGIVLAAVEEERLNRVKHTNRIARHAIGACLDIAGLTIADVDRIAYYIREDVLDDLLARYMLERPHVPTSWRGRGYLAAALTEDLGHPVDPTRLMFVEHHVAHAMSAYVIGPFADALVVTLDGRGDGLSGTVWAGRGGKLKRLRDIPEENSLGGLYSSVTSYLAYGKFDEYKVMGLAAYGDPSRFRHVFARMCTLEDGGRFTVHQKEVWRALRVLPPPRRSGQPMTSMHQDVAAAVQETIERATMHLLAHYQRETGLQHLCLAGGVAHNSTMVGKVARSGLFKGVFVQPAASDAGCALGAALSVHDMLAPDVRCEPLTHVNWGPEVGDRDAVQHQLEPWADLVHVRLSADVTGDAARLLAHGHIIGWMQGRSEFGPRALGNRSILADPRPAANKDRINELVKHRESYRPFAPAVLDEYADRFFEMPPGTCADFMTLTVPVRESCRPVLGAVTHVDGTARVQTVSRATNPRFWALIDAFRTQTGLPVLLNTSFNHSVEPIVQSADDAVACLLTTGLDHVVVGDYIVTKRDDRHARLWTLVPILPEYVSVTHVCQRGAEDAIVDVFRCEDVATPYRTRRLSRAVYQILQHADGDRSLGELLDTVQVASDREVVATELVELWTQRLLQLLPVARSIAARGGHSRQTA